MRYPFIKQIAGFCLMVAVLTIPSTVQADITVHWDIPNRVDRADCNGVTPGYTDGHLSFNWALNPEPVVGAIPAQFTNYTAVWLTNNLNGNLYFDWFQAYDSHTNGLCSHGIGVTFNYVPATNDPAGLDWIQMYTYTNTYYTTLFGNYQSSLDPPPGREIPVMGVADNSPFYFNTNFLDRNLFCYVENLPGVVFGDTPSSPHPEATPASGSFDFELFLAAPDPNNSSQLNVYANYVNWGYDWICVPEPTTVSIVVIGLVALHLLRKKKE